MPNECGLIPMEFNVVVKPKAIEEKTAGGVFLPTTATDREKLAVVEAELVAVSPHAFTYADWPEGARKPEVGDQVIIAKHAGAIHSRNGTDYRIVKDKDIVAIVA